MNEQMLSQPTIKELAEALSKILHLCQALRDYKRPMQQIHEVAMRGLGLKDEQRAARHTFIERRNANHAAKREQRDMSAASRQALTVLREVLTLADGALAGVGLQCGDAAAPACFSNPITCCGKPVDAKGRVQAAIAALERESRAELISRSLKQMTNAELIAYSQAERARWANAQPPAVTSTWSPTMTEQQKAAHQQYVIEHQLPF